VGQPLTQPATWRTVVLTLLPEAFPGPLGLSLAGRDLAEGLWSLQAVGLREFGLGQHRIIDDTPAGGGPGMVMRADVVAAALAHARSDPAVAALPAIYLSPRGRPLDQPLVRQWAAGPGLLMLAGRFEGVDERAIEACGLTEVSVGDFVLSGGEIPALAAIDACVRLLPGVMGKATSGTQESFENDLLEYPQYTRPRDWQGRAIPEILLSGDHARIAAWREAEARRITAERRPDLAARWQKPGKPS
jgi:tRNA (guanine37-N1)-methyltransferase